MPPETEAQRWGNKTMNSVCAYCGQPGALTREHIYPQFLYKLSGTPLSGFNEAANKVTHGERFITDVCKACNNGPLGDLDSYGRVYFHKNDLQRTFSHEGTTTVYYDYHLLVRWLLKVSFNSYRTIHDEPGLFAPLIPYILRDEKRPPEGMVRVSLEVIRDHKIGPENILRVPEAFAQSGFIPCHGFRTGRLVLPYEISAHLMRHFQINSHFLILLIFPEQTDEQSRSRIERDLKLLLPDCHALDPRQSQMVIPISRRDTINVFHDYLHPQQRMIESQHRTKS